MLGHKWEAAEGTIVEAQSGPAAGHGLGALHPEHQYVIEVRMPTGKVIRGAVTEKGIFVHAVGATIGVEVNTKTHEIRLDPNARADSVRAMMHAAEQMRGTAGAAGLAGLAGALGAAAGGASAHMIGPGGQELPIHANPGEISNLAQAMMSGDPAARQAAVDRLRQLREHASERAASHHAGTGPVSGEGFSGSSGPGTFDEIGAPRHPSAAGSGAFGEPADSFSFGQPATPSPYHQVSPPAPVAPTSSFGAFDTGGGEGTVEQRIARLQQQLDKGILTESEFQAKRQQIINGT